MKSIIRTIGNTALDLLYPPDLYCVCCGKIIDSSRTYRLCNDCMDGIKWIGERTCSKCGKRLAEINPMDTCFSCREHEHSYDRGYTCAEYGTHERAMVYALKYDSRPDIADTIGEIMYDRMRAEFGRKLGYLYDLILPVPVSRRRKSRRGYNQAALIAEAFCRRAGLTCDDDILIRVRDTHAMRSLSPDQRRENILGAFEIRSRRREDISGKTLLLIDDIYTTGATSDEIARILKEPWEDLTGEKQAGASRVDVLTFAAGADMVKSSDS
ncbi:MAG: ComF family protein [Mogibacterium sp.]|nr:ComF family protein [Mogibacterium sp.]